MTKLTKDTYKEIKKGTNIYQTQNENDPMYKVNIIDWFDIYNKDHLQAYKHLEKTGTWPKDFIPDHVLFSTNWNIVLMQKMAIEYVDSFVFDEKTPKFEDLFDSKKQAVTAYLRLERKYLSLDPKKDEAWGII